ncbi:MAG: hypothetical protein ACE148_00020 [Vicinamibacterales bacterium]
MPRQRTLVVAVLLATLAAAAPARAQYRGYTGTSSATAENYRVEATVGFWNPTPEIFVTSESLGIPGDRIDGVTDLGFVKKRFPDFRLVLRPALKHKFRFSYVPINYRAEATLSRDIVFNGLKYRVGLPVNSELDWKAYRLGYEYDFLYRSRWFVGFILDVKYTDARVDLNSPVDHEWARAQMPIPALGGIARVFVVPSFSITGEVTGFKLPESIDEDYGGRYIDFDVYGTFNANRNFGVQAGFRSIDVDYRVELDNGAFNLKGLYLAAVARF